MVRSSQSHFQGRRKPVVTFIPRPLKARARDMANLDSWQPWFAEPGSRIRGGMTRIEPFTPADRVSWSLAPSKSHMIRWLLLAAQGSKEVRLEFDGTPGEDAVSMARCLSQLGVEILKEEQAWTVKGVGPQGFQRPVSVLNCGNSGTALRFLTIAAARIEAPVMLDGDSTLRRRHSKTLLSILEYLGAKVSHGTGLETLPYLVHGPFSSGEVNLDVSRSSQPLSALLLSMPAMDSKIRVNISGEGVSKRHAALSFELARLTGSNNEIDWRPYIELEPWEINCPEVVQIPPDTSLEAFAMLFGAIHGITVDITNCASDEDSLGAEIIRNLGEVVDLTNANDLVPPLAAYMSIGEGGTITGAAHARYKESNRLEKTAELLSSFGLEVEVTEDGLVVPGGQIPKTPEGVVDSYLDHRQWMTAACLASKVGGTISHEGVYAVSDPDFPSRIS